MQINENHRFIYIRSINKQIPVSEEEFTSFYNKASVFRRKQQRHNLCCCPKDKWLSCDTDCDNCPYRLCEDTLSLDYTVSDDEGNETSWADSLPDGSPLIEDLVSDGIEMQRLFARLCELMPEAIRVAELRQSGMSDAKIAEEIGIPRTTFLSRINKIKETLRSEFPDMF